MFMLVTLTATIISLCICTLKHHVARKYTQQLFFLILVKKIQSFIWYAIVLHFLYKSIFAFFPSNISRYKPMQKVDGVADGFTGSGQQTGTSVEQTVIAQSQHHQQFLGMLRCNAY